LGLRRLRVVPDFFLQPVVLYVPRTDSGAKRRYCPSGVDHLPQLTKTQIKTLKGERNERNSNRNDQR
jgi:hypothetical protein